MAVNITVHGNPLNYNICEYEKPIFYNEDYKKNEIERRRKLRLLQVRQQSKEIASSIRKQISEAERHKLNSIQKTKAKELAHWKANEIKRLNNEYKYNLKHVGDAHRNAMSDNKYERNNTIQVQSLRSKNAARRAQKKCSENSKEQPVIAGKQLQLLRKPVMVPQSNNGLNHIDENHQEIHSNNPINILNVDSDSNTSDDRDVNVINEKKSVISKTNFQCDDLISNTSLNSEKAQINSADEQNTSSDISSIILEKTKTIPLKITSSMKSKGKQINSLLSFPNTTCLSGNNLENFMSDISSVSSLVVDDITKQPFTQITDLIKNRQIPNIQCEKQKVPKTASPPIVETSTAIMPAITKTTDAAITRNTIPTTNTPLTINVPSQTVKKNIPIKHFSKITHLKPKKSCLKKSSTNSLKNIFIPLFHPQSQKSPAKPKLKESENGSNKSVKRKSSATVIDENVKHDDQQLLYPKVIYYDHKNLYGKEYQQPKDIITKIESLPDGELNAMDNAEAINNLEFVRLKEYEDVKKRENLRTKQALEKVNARRNYDLLTEQLEELTKEKSNCQLSEFRLKQLANNRQQKMNNEIENLLNKPVLITCPKMNQQINSKSKSDSLNSSSDINVGNTKFHQQITDLSDSCGSFILDSTRNQQPQQIEQINNELKQLLDEIKKQKSVILTEIKQQKQSDEKSQQEQQKENMNSNISNNNNSKNCDINLKPNNLKDNKNTIENEIKQLENKRQELLEFEKQIIEKINELKRNERYEQKANQDKIEIIKNPQVILQTDNIKIINEQINKSNDSSAFLSNSNVSTESSNAPVKIVIKVLTDKNKKKKPDIEIVKISDKPSTNNYPRTPMKTKPIPIDHESTSTSTAYHSPPRKIQTDLSNFLINEKQQELQQQQHQQNSKPQQQQQQQEEQQHFHQQQQHSQQNKSAAPEKNQISKKPLSLLLTHYIQRLLGMSRASIEQLGVSCSTSIETPTDSIINVSQNMSSSEQISSFRSAEQLPDKRMEKLQEFIEKNYTFLKEIEQSIKQKRIEEDTNNVTNETNLKQIESIWMEMLQKKEDDMKKLKLKYVNLKELDIQKAIQNTNQSISSKQQPEKETSQLHQLERPEDISENVNQQKPIKPILKKPVEHSTPKHMQPQFIDNNLLEKYSKITENCTKRITDLAEMLAKIRKEKEKLLETTLSSDNEMNSKEQNSTEYLDFPSMKNNHQQQLQPDDNYENNSSKGSDIKTLSLNKDEDVSSAAVLTSDNINNQLLGNIIQQIGHGSRDSGICISRPVTSSDILHSPDLKLTNKCDINDMPSNNTDNILKDIEKLPTSSQSFDNNIDKIINYDLLQWQGPLRKIGSKPPASLNRYSPQLEQEIPPHELSTIIEVDTPATSKINVTITAQNNEIKPNSHIIDEENYENLLARKLPPFIEYAKQHNLDLTKFDVDTSNTEELTEELKRLLITDEINFNELKCKKFVSPNKYINRKHEQTKPSYSESSSITNELSIDNDNIHQISSTMTSSMSSSAIPSDETQQQMKMNKFPVHKEYAKNVSQLIDSTNVIDTICDSSESYISIPDVMNELRKRNIMQHSFESDSQKSDELVDIDEKLSDKNLVKHQETSAIKKDDSIPTTVAADDKNDNNSYLSDTLQTDLKSIGLKWASTMLRKTKETQAILSSSISSDDRINKYSRRLIENKNVIKSDTDNTTSINESSKQNVNTSNNNNDAGKPLNLRDFLERELLKHSSNTSSTSLSSSASPFLKTLCGDGSISTISTNSIPVWNNHGPHSTQKTSTPIQSSPLNQSGVKNVNNSGTIENHQNIESNLFSGESRLSSVKNKNEISSSSYGSDKNSIKNC